MALQDLTPQLRTRLSRVERAVGFFVTIATVLLLVGFAYYIYHTAERKGWFKTKIAYSTSLNNAAGLKVGDAVKLMGFSVGEITKVEANAPGAYYGVTVYFRVMEPYYGYIWLDSKVRVAPADFLGNRNIEIIKGENGAETVWEENNRAVGLLRSSEAKALYVTLSNDLFSVELDNAKKQNPQYTAHAQQMEAVVQTLNQITNRLTRLIKSDRSRFYGPIDPKNPYWVEPLESPALTERLESVVNTVESALPGFFELTNQLSAVLTRAEDSLAKINETLAEAKPTLTNVAVITSNLRDPKGSLGEWILPPSLLRQLTNTLASADETLASAKSALNTGNSVLANTDTNLTTLVSNINLSLVQLADLTGSLNSQVQANSNIVSSISKIIVDTDDFVQGLKHHWLLRSAFKKKKTDIPPQAPAPRMSSPRDSR